MSRLTDPIVLAIDSDIMSLAATKTTLSEFNYDVFVASSAETAKQIASQLEIDLLICATRVNYKSGERLVTEIKQLPERHDVPVIFGSDTQRLDVACRRHSFGQAYHLKKPYRPEVLAEFVEQVLWIPDQRHHGLNQPHFHGHASTSSTAPTLESANVEGQVDSKLFPGVHMPLANTEPANLGVANNRNSVAIPGSLIQPPHSTDSFF